MTVFLDKAERDFILWYRTLTADEQKEVYDRIFEAAKTHPVRKTESDTPTANP